MLSRPDLEKYIKRNRLRFDPVLPPDAIAQASIDLRLGRSFTIFKSLGPEYVSSIRMDPSIWGSLDLWEHSESDSFCLKPNQFVLAKTLERVSIPPDLVGFVEGRSSFARVGITVHVTAPKIDPGFDGTITLEMKNFGPVAVDLRAGIDQPAQLILMKLSTKLSAAELYGTRPTDVFQNQSEPIPRARKKSTTKSDRKSKSRR